MHKQAEDKFDDHCAAFLAWVFGFLALAFVLGCVAYVVTA
jgi:hypothetical protein